MTASTTPEHEPSLLGIVEMGARQYSPSLGRFLEVDAVEGGSCNGYEYTCGDPVGAKDLDGEAVTYPDSPGYRVARTRGGATWIYGRSTTSRGRYRNRLAAAASNSRVLMAATRRAGAIAAVRGWAAGGFCPLGTHGGPGGGCRGAAAARAVGRTIAATARFAYFCAGGAASYVPHGAAIGTMYGSFAGAPELGLAGGTVAGAVVGCIAGVRTPPGPPGPVFMGG